MTAQPHALTAALPLPQQTELVIHRLLRHLTLYQVQTLADQLDQVLAHGGYGEVSVVIEKNHARRVRLTLSVDITPQLPSANHPLPQVAGALPVAVATPPANQLPQVAGALPVANDLSTTPVIHSAQESP